MMIPSRRNFFDEVFDEPIFSKKEAKMMKTDIKEKDGKFFMGDQELDSTNFRYKTSADTNGQPILQKRIMYVKRYKVFNYLNKDKTKIVAHTLYQLSDINEFKKAMKNLPDYKEEDAYNQRASII